jgi:hypothetical protein
VNDVAKLYELIKRYRLDWRHPELARIVKRIEKGRLRPDQARRWLKRIKPWVEEQERCFNPLRPAPDQSQLGSMDAELGELIERKGVRYGLRIRQPGKSLMACGTTGAGKSTILRRLVNELDRINRDALALHHHSDS